jgi:hypothetical protein
MNETWSSRLLNMYQSDPLFALAATAAVVALATTPLAFAILGRSKWFKARRGRVLQTPEFSSIVAAMILVMGIPAIFLGLAVKSRYFDENRYAFDPNKTLSVLDQGRGYADLKEADEAVRAEMKRLAEERKNLADSVRKLDEAMLALRVSAAAAPGVAQKLPEVLQRLAKVRSSVGIDGPQQLMDFTAPPQDIAGAVGHPASVTAVAGAPASAVAVAAPVAPVAPAPVVNGLSKEQITAEIAAVPEPQKTIAAMLPLTNLPAGWVVAKSGDRYLETFNAENLFEKIDGRAESFVDYKVKGMAYTYYHPNGDPSNEVQVYIFELSDTLKALGKYGTEKPDDVKPLKVGADGYTSAGSTFFYSGPYYTQIVTTKDDAAFAEFALTIAHKIAAAQKPGGSGAAPAVAEGVPTTPNSTTTPKPTVAGGTPEGLFALLPNVAGKTSPTYVPADVFGYSFLSEVFMAEYSEGSATWKGFVRPYGDPAEAKAVFEKYLASAKQDGAEIKEEKVDGADRFVVATNIGLTDIIFLKGNTLAGAAGATDPKAATTFTRAFAQSLPVKVEMVGGK